MSGQNKNSILLKIRGYALKFISKLNLIEEVRVEAIEILEAIKQDADFLSRSNPKGYATVQKILDKVGHFLIGV
jgi:transcription initiation factor TFIIIB Brf1 subunit/transcription initiation factor TFIIB